MSAPRITRIVLCAASLAACCAIGCAPGKYADGSSKEAPAREKLYDMLTLFVEAVQAERYDMAFGYLTPEERAKMTAGGGVGDTLLLRRLKALRLSTLAHKPSVRLVDGKVEGVFDQLPELAQPTLQRGPETPLLP